MEQLEDLSNIPGAINSTYYSALEVKQILESIGYKILLTPQKHGDVLSFPKLLHNSSIWDRENSFMLESDNFDSRLLGALIHTLLQRDIRDTKAYQTVIDLFRKHGITITKETKTDDAKSHVVYLLRQILLPDKIRNDRTINIRSNNAKQNISSIINERPEMKARLKDRMGNRGYFPQSFEREVANELVEMINDPEQRKRFEENDGRLKRSAVQEYVMSRIKDFDNSRQEPYGEIKPENRKYYPYVEDFIYRKEHTSIFIQQFHATRRRFGINDHPGLDFDSIFKTEIIPHPELFPAHIPGFSRTKIVKYLMDKYGKTEFETVSGEVIQIELYIDEVMVHNLLRKLSKEA